MAEGGGMDGMIDSCRNIEAAVAPLSRAEASPPL
jgi:hypothetical protein